MAVLNWMYDIIFHYNYLTEFRVLMYILFTLELQEETSRILLDCTVRSCFCIHLI